MVSGESTFCLQCWHVYLRRPEVQQRRGQTGLSNPFGHALRVGLSLIEAIQDRSARCVGTRMVEACLFHLAHDRRLFCLVEPTKEFGMHDYRLDEVEKPEHHPDAVRRLTEPLRRPVSNRGGELPGRKIDGRP